MGGLGKAALYAGLVALGFGTCYLGCVDRHYKVVQERGEMYVLDRSTGRMAEVGHEFCTREELRERSRDLADRLEDAYKAFTR
jgi:hypothetical protein